MASLFNHTRAIKHDYFIKTGEGLWPAVAKAVARAGVICYSLTTVIPHSITHCSKSYDPSRVHWKRSTRERATLIKALLNLTISVRYRRAITPALLLLPLSCSHLPLPLLYITLALHPLFSYSSAYSINTSPLVLSLLFSSFSTCVCERNSPTLFPLLIAAHNDFL